MSKEIISIINEIRDDLYQNMKILNEKYETNFDFRLDYSQKMNIIEENLKLLTDIESRVNDLKI